LNEKGWQIDIFEDHRKTLNKLSSLKSTNSLPYILAGIYKKEKKLDECIILNELGNISEAITSNIFIVYNGVFYTPSLNKGCIGGIMRKVIIDMVKEGGREVQECPLNPNALLRADEVFLTNSINGIRWVNAYRMKRYFNKASKLLVEQLNDRITAQVMLGVSVSS
jgi:4-amino-4-deoxychorismate lyase